MLKVEANQTPWSRVRLGRNGQTDQVKNAVARAHAHFGRLDIIINNAGYALAGAIEESDEADIRAQFETNFFGSLQVIPAVLPLLRQQGNGHILGVSSVFAWAARPPT